MREKEFWLIKTEGSCYSINDLKRDKKAAWTGIRNYQARNFMRDSMHIGDLALFYHSNGTTEEPTGIYGIAKVVRSAYPDPTQFDKKDEHYDPKSKNDLPSWVCVDMAFVKKFKTPVTLAQMKRDTRLRGMAVLEQGSRLSVMPVAKNHFAYITEVLAK